MQERIYLDYAATSPVRREVLEVMLPYLTDSFGNADSVHAYGRDAAYAVETARLRVAETLGVRPTEVFFTSGGTEAGNWAVQKLGTGGACISAIEHACVLNAARLREGGYSVAVANGAGHVTAEAVQNALKEDMGLVAVMAVNNETGCIQPIEKISTLCAERGVLLFCDCVQAACGFDLKEIMSHCDAASLSAHKCNGPKGTGALVVKHGALKPMIVGGEQERGLRGGTLNVAGIVGFAEALARAQAERTEFCNHTRTLRDLFEKKVLNKLGERVRVDGETRAPNISHLTFLCDGAKLLAALDLKGVAASGGAACSAHSAQPSHVLLAMGRSEREAQSGVRFSFGRETTEEQTLRTAEIVCVCAEKLIG